MSDRPEDVPCSSGYSQMSESDAHKKLAELRNIAAEKELAVDGVMFSVLQKRETYPGLIKDMYIKGVMKQLQETSEGRLNFPRSDPIDVMSYKKEIKERVANSVNVDKELNEIENRIKKEREALERKRQHSALLLETLMDSEFAPCLSMLNA